uniref:Lys-63-specific deubiquitinase BRCC36 n=2 Tax=Schistocephalus solidus TaxID=70667 RepID=A0A0X3P0H6_SCHSO
MMEKQVIVTPEAYQIMLLHAFTHEREEVGGVLVGEGDGNTTSVITVFPLQRTSQQSDRVDISAAELAGCIEKCEDISKYMKCPVSVVGWYHSHPHITPFPSHVDLQTQLNFQSMDQNFIGLIFSVFVHQANSPTQVVSLLGFQSNSAQKEKRLKVRIQSLPNSQPSFYHVSCRLWRSVSDCIKDEFISKLAAFISEAEPYVPDGLKLLQCLLRTLEAADSITESMATFGALAKLGLDLADDSKSSTTI